MPLTMTARRSIVAREIKASLAEAEAELEKADADHRESLIGLITALHERLNNRRSVVLAARQASLMRGIFRRRARFRASPVWGFPNSYNPNDNQDRCEICRSINWLGQAVPGQSFTAWRCATCPTLPTTIPIT